MSNIPSTSICHTEDERALLLIDGLANRLPNFLQQSGAPGIQIAVALGGRLVWEAGCGYADVHSGTPMTPDTVFLSGSMGKVYTGIAIMQLVEQGILDLESPVTDCLPFEVVNPLGGCEITISHLMTHTSGLTGDSSGCSFHQSRSLEHLLRECYSREEQPLMGGLPTWSAPTGKQRMYSNIGISTLGLIVQRYNPDGLTYGEYVEKNIMRPLAMHSSQYPLLQTEEFVRPELWSRLGTGYNAIGNVWIPSPHVRIESSPAGAFVSVPRDHLRLLLALQNGGQIDGARILAVETVEQMLSSQLEAPFTHAGAVMPREQQGLIWWLKDWEQALHAFYHGGGHMYGWQTMGVAWPEHGAAVCYAINEWSSTKTRRYFGAIEGYIESWLRSEPPRPSCKVVQVDNLEWKASYLRGLLFVESYRYGVGVPEVLDSGEAMRIADQAVNKYWGETGPSTWDADAFVEGVSDMNNVDPTTEAIQEFARSRMRLSLDDARQIMPMLGDRHGYANLAGLLN